MKNSQPKQLALMKKGSLSYGGELLKTRKGRAGGRPLSTKNSMHLVLRSTKAKGNWSFRTPKNSRAVREIVGKFSQKYGVKMLSLANVGNHLHFHLQLRSRHAYKAFIRSITSAIAMTVSGVSRWSRKSSEEKQKFWDYRPFTRVVLSLQGFLNMKDYLQINVLEGEGVPRFEARMIIQRHSLPQWQTG